MTAMTKTRTRRFLWIAATSSVAATIIACGLFVFHRVPIVEFTPACDEIAEYRQGGHFQLKKIEGQISREFAREYFNYMMVPPNEKTLLKSYLETFRQSGYGEERAREAAREFVDYLIATPVDKGIIALRNGKILVTLAAKLSYDKEDYELARRGADTALYSNFSAYSMTEELALKIFRRRKAEGVITDDILKAYQVKPWDTDEPIRQLEHNECGLTEELILKGGRLARD